MDNHNLGAEVRKKAIQPGIILGVATLILSIFTLFFITEIASSYGMMVSSPFLFGIIIPIIITVFLMFDLRKQIGGFWSFKQATTGAFVIFLIAYLISFAGNLVYTKVIDKAVVGKMATQMTDATVRMMENSGVDQAKIDETEAKMNQQFKEQENPSIGTTLKSMLIAVLMYFIISLILGALFKKEEVKYAPIDNE